MASLEEKKRLLEHKNISELIQEKCNRLWDEMKKSWWNDFAEESPNDYVEWEYTVFVDYVYSPQLHRFWTSRPTP